LVWVFVKYVLFFDLRDVLRNNTFIDIEAVLKKTKSIDSF